MKDVRSLYSMLIYGLWKVFDLMYLRLMVFVNYIVYSISRYKTLHFADDVKTYCIFLTSVGCKFVQNAMNALRPRSCRNLALFQYRRKASLVFVAPGEYAPSFLYSRCSDILRISAILGTGALINPRLNFQLSCFQNY